MEQSVNLSISEQKFLLRLMRYEKMFLAFCLVGVLAGLSILTVSLVRGTFNMQRLVIITLILLQSRSNLKQHKAAKIFKKLNPLPS
jgi:hypothetical protein